MDRTPVRRHVMPTLLSTKSFETVTQHTKVAVKNDIFSSKRFQCCSRCEFDPERHSDVALSQRDFLIHPESILSLRLNLQSINMIDMNLNTCSSENSYLFIQRDDCNFLFYYLFIWFNC